MRLAYQFQGQTVKRSKVKVTGGRWHTVTAELGGHTACFHFVTMYVMVMLGLIKYVHLWGTFF